MATEAIYPQDIKLLI